MKLCISVCKAENCETEMKYHFEKTNMYVSRYQRHTQKQNEWYTFSISEFKMTWSRLMDVAECETKVSVLFETTT